MSAVEPDRENLVEHLHLTSTVYGAVVGGLVSGRFQVSMVTYLTHKQEVLRLASGRHHVVTATTIKEISMHLPQCGDGCQSLSGSISTSTQRTHNNIRLEDLPVRSDLGLR